MTQHWAQKYIGTPWVFGGRKPGTGLDCWGLFKLVQAAQFGVEVPEIELEEFNIEKIAREFRSHPEYDNWREVELANEGDAVLLTSGKYPNHVGTWIRDGERAGVLHTVESHGCIFSTFQQLRLAGWKLSSVYQRKKR